MIAAIWLLTATGLVVWTLMAWALHAVLRLTPGWAGEVKPWLDRVPAGDWLEHWLPGWRRLAEALIDMMQAVLALLGSVLGEWGAWLVWGTWGIGALLMLGLAGILHAIVRATVARPPVAAPRAG